MSNLALKIDQCRRKHLDAPDIKAPIFLAYSADAPVAPPAVYQPSIFARVATALNKSFAFVLLVVVCTAIFWAGAGLGKFEDDIEIRVRAAALTADTSLPAPLQQIGTFDREAGGRR